MTTVMHPETTFPDLHELAQAKRQDYRSAEPIPHYCFDGLVPELLLEDVLAEFPAPEREDWRRLENPTKSRGKMITADVDQGLGPAAKHLFGLLAAPGFLCFLEDLTGIKGLIPDPYLHAAGLHQIETGGFLEIHSDFDFHPRLNLHRRINVLLYLNKDWPEEYGGHLELWDRTADHCVAKYLPTWNRMLIHNVVAHAYHGFPEPIRCPEGMTRKSLAAWYFTSRRPAHEIKAYQAAKPDWIKRSAASGDA